MLKVLVACLAAATLTAAFARGSSAEFRERQRIVALETIYTQSLLRKDTSKLGSILADDFLDTSMTGEVRTKAQLLALIRQSPAPGSIDEDKRRIELYPGAAVVSVRFTATGTDSGRKYSETGRATDVWLKVGGTWKCVSAQSSPISAK